MGEKLDRLAADLRIPVDILAEALREFAEETVGRSGISIPEGWIEWFGGECPVSGGTTVDVMFRNGEVAENRPADTWLWEYAPSIRGDHDIIAYRVRGAEVNPSSDLDFEDGDYTNRCVQCDHLFRGHKHQLICAVCSQQIAGTDGPFVMIRPKGSNQRFVPGIRLNSGGIYDVYGWRYLEDRIEIHPVCDVRLCPD